MKINGQNTAVDLIQRMQDAHKSEKTSPTKDFKLGGPQKVGKEVETSPLDGKLRISAEKALSGEIKTARELRLEVISHIVDEKLDGIAKTRVTKKKLVQGLESTLLSDPEFGKQIDDMMVMAARSIAKKA